MKKIIAIENTKLIGKQLDANGVKYNPEQFITGLESRNGNGSTNSILNINDFLPAENFAPVHLNKFPKNNDIVKKTKNMQNEPHNTALKRCAVDATIDSIVDSPFTETYQSEYKENRREHRHMIIEHNE